MTPQHLLLADRPRLDLKSAIWLEAANQRFITSGLPAFDQRLRFAYALNADRFSSDIFADQVLPNGVGTLFRQPLVVGIVTETVCMPDNLQLGNFAASQ